jgi:hypothetical protein
MLSVSTSAVRAILFSLGEAVTARARSVPSNKLPFGYPLVFDCPESVDAVALSPDVGALYYSRRL